MTVNAVSYTHLLDEEKLDFLYNKGDSLKKRAHTNYHTTTLRNGWLQDVYKRQIFLRPDLPVSCDFPVYPEYHNIHKVGDRINFTIFHRYIPVSYTHLDVYKRQLQGYLIKWQAMTK